ncbi:MAG: hypothetical protein AB1750_11095 [Chloroflexota bacterium]
MKTKLIPLFLILYFALLWVIQLFDVRRFIVDDSYFYLVIARNIALHGEQTFSGLFSTNGIHPLWLYLLSAWDWVVSLACVDCLYNLYWTLPLNLGMLALGGWAGWQTAGRLGINRALFASLPMGFLSAFHTLNSEAFLYYASLSVLLLLALDTGADRKRRLVAIGLAGAAVFLSRLDAVFFVAAFFVWLWFRWRNVKDWLIAALVAGTLGLAYILSNVWLFGGAVPVSGWLKSTFPEPSVRGWLISNLATAISGYNILFGVAPLALSALAILVLRRRLQGDIGLINPLWVGGVFHFLYTAGFTRGADSWLWYYVLPILLGALSLALLIELLPGAWRGRATLLVLGLSACFCLAYTLRTLVRPLPASQGEVMLAYLEQNGINDSTLVVTDSPGEVAFFSGNRVIGLDMLTANRLFVNDMLAAPNGLQFILDRAAQAGYPADYLLLTSDTWLGNLIPSPDLEEVEFAFLIPGTLRDRSSSHLRLGPPIFLSDRLAVWKLEAEE